MPDTETLDIPLSGINPDLQLLPNSSKLTHHRGEWPVDHAPPFKKTPVMSSRFAQAMTVMLALALFCLVFGSKLAVIDRFGSDLPNWDQWDAEGAQMFLPYSQHRLGFLDFFTPHNEHRVACTRALAFGLLLLNGQWDARLECVANAGLHSALALAIFLYGRALLGRRWRGVWFATVAALTALPIAWQNVLGGFHSQQYFLLWFSLAALALLLTAPPWTGRWWGGVACAALALFSMGSGLLAAGVAAAVLADQRPPARRLAPAWRHPGGLPAGFRRRLAFAG